MFILPNGCRTRGRGGERLEQTFVDPAGRQPYHAGRAPATTPCMEAVSYRPSIQNSGLTQVESWTPGWACMARSAGAQLRYSFLDQFHAHLDARIDAPDVRSEEKTTLKGINDASGWVKHYNTVAGAMTAACRVPGNIREPAQSPCHLSSKVSGSHLQ